MVDEAGCCMHIQMIEISICIHSSCCVLETGEDERDRNRSPTHTTLLACRIGRWSLTSRLCVSFVCQKILLSRQTWRSLATYGLSRR